MVNATAPAPPRPGTTAAGAETRARLVEAAVEVFLEHGYARTRVQDIARRAGLTTGAMYAHFENKAALLSEAIAHYGEDAISQVVEALDDGVPGSFGTAMGVDLLSGPTEPIHRLILEALAVAARGEEPADIIAPAIERMGSRIRARVAEAHADGRIPPDIQEDALVALFQRLVLGSIVAKAVELPTTDPAASEHLMAVFLGAIVASDAGS